MHSLPTRLRRTRRGPTRCAALCGMLLSLTAGAAFAGTYEITVENLVPGGMATGNPLTPPVAVVAADGCSPGVLRPDSQSTRP